jgi:HAD superfamily hydrolase (TIGR01490 family)
MILPPLHKVSAGVFFDLEKTFCADPVEQVAATAMWRLGELRNRDIARVLWCYLRYNLGLLGDFDALKAEGATVFRGRPLARDVARFAELYRDQLARRVFPEAADVARQAKGYFLAFISSTYHFMVLPFADAHGFDASFGCHLSEVDGICTGELVGPVFHQEAKAECLRQLARAHGLDLAQSWAFGDSINDAAMLGVVGCPVAVNPSTKLRARATAEGWRMVSWSLDSTHDRVHP